MGIISSYKTFQLIVEIILFSLGSSFLSVTGVNEIFLYVSPEGSDSSAGNSIGKPFATIQKARDALRKMKKEGKLKKPVTVYIRDGLYELSVPIIFTPEDSGTESSPITYTAYKDEAGHQWGQENSRDVEGL